MSAESGKLHPQVIRFIGTRLGPGPDAKTIHKYRAALAESGQLDELFAVMTDPLAAQGYELKESAMIARFNTLILSL